MKKYHCICLFFICLIATSCENAILEENPVTPATTRSNYDELGYYGSNFRNITVYTSKYGADQMVADIEVNPGVGSEYSCTLGSTVGNEGVKSKVSVTGATIIYNGREDTYIYGTGGQMKFTIKTRASRPTVTLSFEVPTKIPNDSRVEARLVITKRQFNGIDLPNVSSGFPDLNVSAFYGGVPHQPETAWLCNSCGHSNSMSLSTCEFCGKSIGSY